MPSALETLVKILKLEQSTGYQNTAVIGGLESFVENWCQDAHQQAKRPEHHQLVDELVVNLRKYSSLDGTEARHESVHYMLGRIMGRIPAPSDLPPSTYQPEEPEPVVAPDLPSASSEVEDAPHEDHFDADEVSSADEAEEEIIEEAAPDVIKSRPTPPPRSRRRKREPLSPDEARAQLAALQSPVTTLQRVGSKMAEKFEKLGLYTIEDMLFHFPRRHDDYTHMRTLNRLVPGEVVTIIAAVHSVTKQVGRQGNPYLLVTLDDETGQIHIRFFGQLWLQRQFKTGTQIVLSGEVELFRGQLTMTNPEWEMLERDNLHTGRIVPVYPLTQGLSARTMRRLMRQALDQWIDRIPDYMPPSVLERTDFPDIGWAIEQVHFPESQEHLALARQRLSFDELFLFQTAMLGQRRDWQSVPGQPLSVPDEWLQHCLATLPYALTNAQQRALDDIRADLARDVPMNRLLQGDVGSGKTVVAALGMAMAANQGKQAALMAPTSILAEQHARRITTLLCGLPGAEQWQVRLLTGNTSETERAEIYRGLAEGWIQIVIGTHALIQEGVSFHDLAVAVIDEQHRFGVEQRAILRAKGTNPHLLVMTATPIPRTLALTLYADLDLSIIDEMPPGRTPVDTRVLTPVERERVYAFVRSQLDQGRQAFIVYPLVELSDKLQEVGAATEAYDHLRTEVFHKYRVGLLHGRLSPAEKDTTMAAFAAGEYDVLVSTSVVEVGIDVPNASTILIEDANRFGLAQLHQFRGRVGRGEHKSYCLLIAASATDEAQQRLQAMEDTTDGFKLAEIDWKLRGAGDLLGLRQSGMGQFRLTEMMNPRLVELAQREARTVFSEDSHFALPEHQILAQRIQMLMDRRADIS